MAKQVVQCATLWLGGFQVDACIWPGQATVAKSTVNMLYVAVIIHVLICLTSTLSKTVKEIFF
jgi:hypothetical protein